MELKRLVFFGYKIVPSNAFKPRMIHYFTNSFVAQSFILRF